MHALKKRMGEREPLAKARRREVRTVGWDEGLCLPEVLVSALIALIGISAILASFLSGRLASAAAKHQTQAMNLASERMEYLKSLRYNVLSSMPAVTTETDLPLDERDGGNFVPCTRTTTLTPADDGITVVVVVSWSNKAVGAAFVPTSYQLKTWVCSPSPPPVAGG